MPPLLHPAARARRGALLERSWLDPTGDPLVTTPFDPVLHTVRFGTLPAELLDQLGTVEHDTDRTTGRVVRRHVPLWVRQPDGIDLPSRLVPLVQQYFRQAHGRADSTAVVPDVAAFAGLADPLVPAALAAYGRAVVQCGSGVCRSRLVEQLLRSRPSRRAAVVGLNRREVRRTVADLRAAGVDAGGFYELAIDGRPEPAVAVGTPAGLASPSAAVGHVGLVVVLDPVGFCGPRGIGLRSVENLVGVPWLGVLPADRPLAPLERDLLTAFFGPFQYDLPAHGQVGREVLFAAQPITLPHKRGHDRVVMALAGELAHRRPGVSSRRFGVARQADAVRGPVVVLAHDDEHRVDLRRVLRPADRPQVAVVTPAELAGLTDVGIVVRADRRPHLPPLSPAALVELQIARHPLLLVDATGPDGHRLVGRRAREYRAAGWTSLAAWVGGWMEWEKWAAGREARRRSAPA